MIRPNRNIAVMYHYVRPTNGDGAIGITPEALAEQIRTIRRHYEIVTVQEYAARKDRDGGLAVLTFDDGLRDHYEHALPVLESLDAPAVFFVPARPQTSAIGGWCNQHLLHAEVNALGWDKFCDLAFPYIPWPDPLQDDEADRLYHYESDPRRRQIKYAFAFGMDRDQARSVLDRVMDTESLPASDWYAQADQLLEMQGCGHTIGVHGLDHLPYTRMTPKAQCADMQTSLSIINEVCWSMPRPISFPFGRYNDATLEIARACGHYCWFGTSDRIDANVLASVLEESCAHC